MNIKAIAQKDLDNCMNRRCTTTFIEKTFHIFTSRPGTSIYTRDRTFIANNIELIREKQSSRKANMS